MGFNKKYIDYQNTINALQSNRLKADAFIFQDYESEKIYNLFVEGKTDEEIIKLIDQ